MSLITRKPQRGIALRECRRGWNMEVTVFWYQPFLKSYFNTSQTFSMFVECALLHSACLPGLVFRVTRGIAWQHCCSVTPGVKLCETSKTLLSNKGFDKNTPALNVAFVQDTHKQRLPRQQWRNEGGQRGTIPWAPNHYGGDDWGGRRIVAAVAENSQQCHKYFLYYSTFAFERAQVRT